MKYYLHQQIHLRLIFLFGTLSLGMHHPSAQEIESTANDSIKHELREITVEAKRIVRKPDHIEMILSDDNRQFGSTALSAISSLLVFQSTIDTEDLATIDGKDVFVVINGVPSTAHQLASYLPEEIKRVDYYDETPLKYLAYTNGAVAEVWIKRRNDRLFNGYARVNTDLNHFVRAGGNISLAYTDSLNRVNIDYNANGGRGSDNLHKSTVFDYSELGYFRQELESNTDRAFWNQLTATYQRFQGRHLFNTRVQLEANPSHSEEHFSLTREDEGEITNGTSARQLDRPYQHILADVYYKYQLTDTRAISAVLIGDYGRETSAMTLSQDFAKDSYFTSDRNATHNYGGGAQIQYTDRLLGGNFTASASSNFMQVRLRTPDTFSKYDKSRSMIVVGETYSLPRNVSLTAFIGASYSYYKAGAVANHVYSPFVQARVNWWSEKVQGLGISAQILSNRIAPDLGSLSSAVSHIDRYFLATGNPGLKASWNNSANISFSYYDPKGRWMIQLTEKPTYAHNSVMSVLSIQDGYVYKRPENVKNYFQNTLSLSAGWQVSHWLQLQGSLFAYSWRYRTSGIDRSHNYIRPYATATLMLGKWSVMAGAFAPYRYYDGDYTCQQGAEYYATVNYKIGAWSLDLKWNHSNQGLEQAASCAGFNFSESTSYVNFKNRVELGIQWSFAVGRARRHAERDLYLEGSESGLSSDSKGL